MPVEFKQNNSNRNRYFTYRAIGALVFDFEGHDGIEVGGLVAKPVHGGTEGEQR